eukprot:10014817-Lingulodinium_polyedra.AAC.1
MPGARRGFQSVACAKTLFLRQRYVSNTETSGLASLSVAERILEILEIGTYPLLRCAFWRHPCRYWLSLLRYSTR